MGGVFGILFIGRYVGKWVSRANNIMHRAGWIFWYSIFWEKWVDFLVFYLLGAMLEKEWTEQTI